MEQQEFSDYIIPQLLKQFPQFKEACIYKPNGIVDIEYKSKQGLLTLWITTQDKEITIGFSGGKNLDDFHTHMSLFGANTPDEELNEAINFINDIMNDKELIIHSTVLGYLLGDINEIRKHAMPGEIIKDDVWSNL